MKHITIIPSKGRAEYFLRYKDLPIIRFNHPSFNTVLWVYKDEENEYRKTLKELNLNHITIYADKDSINIAQKRQSILNYCKENDYEYLFSPDDDMRFYERKTNFKSLPLDYENNRELFNHLSSICSNKYPLVYFRERYMIQNVKKLYTLTFKVCGIYFIHVPTFIKENISFMYKDNCIYEDSIVQLLLHSKGYRPCSSSVYVVSQRHGDNSTGGCSSYRNIKIANRAAKIIFADFKEYSIPNIKRNWSEGPRIVLRFNFKKFLKENELNYVPKKEMAIHMNRKEAYTIGGLE